MNNPAPEKHIVIGAGPAGLTAAWQLAKLNKTVLILEKDPGHVGGIARTVSYKGYRFDMGGHRFYTKVDFINQLWREMAPEQFIQVPRLSRIFYEGEFFPYPLEIMATLRKLGSWHSFRIGMSYLYARAFSRKQESSLEDWLVNRFGYRLYEMFFKSFTEKVWGISCTAIDKDWAAQRIRGLSLSNAVKDALGRGSKKGNIKTLIKEFIYPRLGPGQLWESVCDKVVARGNAIEFDKTVTKLNHKDGLMTSVQTQDGCRYEGSHFYPTMTLKDLVQGLDPAPPAEILDAAGALSYRSFLTVALIVDKEDLFPDNWIYIHDPHVSVGRIQNYKNWSKDMVADWSKTCLGMEYFCNEGDALWETDDDELVKLAAGELERIGLARASDCVEGYVARIPDAYPVYKISYREHREVLKRWLTGYFKNVYPAGRGALHNYNSQDHSMMTAILSVKNMVEGTRLDVWAVNTDDEYAERGEGPSEIEESLALERLVSEEQLVE